MRTLVRGAALAASAVVVAALTGCPSAPLAERPPVATPRVASRVVCRAGAPLAGGVAAVPSGTRARPEDSLQVVVSFVALERVPEGLLAPLGARARLIATPSGEKALAAEPSLFTGAGADVVTDAQAFASRLEARANRFADRRAALPRGVTATFELVRDLGPRESGSGLEQRVAVHVARKPHEGADALRSADALRLVDALDVALELAAPAAGRLQGCDEIALLDVEALPAGAGLAAVVPSPFEGDEAGAIGLVVTVLPPPPADGAAAVAHRRACADATADLAREATARAESEALTPPVAPPRPGEPGAALPRPDLGLAIRALASASGRRGGLFALAQATGAPLAEEVALAADDPVLEAVANAVARGVTAPGAPAGGAELGWTVERGTLEGLRDLVGTGDAPPRVAGLLVRRAGAAGRSCTLLSGIAEGARSLADFEERLRAENRELLEDGSPVLRASAHAWLASRGLAPEGYAPLAPAEERRAALDRSSGEGAPRGGP